MPGRDTEPGEGWGLHDGGGGVCMRCTLWSELHERPAHAGLLGDDRGAGRCLPPDLPGQFPGLEVLTK